MSAKRIGNGVFFCWNCGARVEYEAKDCPRCGAQYTGEERYGRETAIGAGGVGWSAQACDPFFREYAVKYTRLSIVWMIALSILIPAILLFSGQVKPEGEGLVVLLVVPAVIWVIGLIFLLKKFGGSDKSWDGVVENKTADQRTRREKEGNQNNRTVFYMEYVITIRRQDGSTKTLVSQDNAANYLYFNIGDHVRFHDKKYLKYLEKYDKSRDEDLFCAACGSFNDARDRYCERCGAPMLKGNPVFSSSCAASAPQNGTPDCCVNCGTKLTGGDFCESCGSRVK